MKKYLLTLLLILLVFITGCGKNSGSKVKDSFIKEVGSLKGYYMEGKLSITNNDDTYKYNVKVSYQAPENYKVVLTNNANDYTQILIKNNEGVFVATPALNKTFKFQSNWPNNNSLSYLLSSVANDLNSDKEYAFEEKDGLYTYIVKANYPNNRDLVKQRITIGDNNELKKVEVLNKENISLIEFEVTTLDKKAIFKNDYFKLEEKNLKQDCENCDEEKPAEEIESTISETVFPLYLPENTALSNKEVIKLDNGERVIMTFSGDNPFILVEETVSKEDELTVVPTYGEPFMLVDTVGSLTDMSYTWTSGGIEYYIVSDVLEQNELLEVAKSLNTVSTISTK